MQQAAGRLFFTKKVICGHSTLHKSANTVPDSVKSPAQADTGGQKKRSARDKRTQKPVKVRLPACGRTRITSQTPPRGKKPVTEPKGLASRWKNEIATSLRSSQ
jgi:hypothetical protein